MPDGSNESEPAPKSARRFGVRFSLRTLIGLLTVSALVLGYALNRIREYESAVKSLRSRGFDVDTSIEQLPFGLQTYLPDIMTETAISVKMSPFAMEINGAFGDLYGGVVFNDSQPVPPTPLCDEDLRHLAAFRSLRSLSLEHVPVSDAGLQHLRGLTRLKRLYLSNDEIARDPPISDVGLVCLKGLKNLEELDLYGQGITDEGLADLVPHLSRLKYLGIGQTSVTDECIPFIVQLRNLQWLNIERTKITKAGKAEISRQLPACVIGPGLPY